MTLEKLVATRDAVEKLCAFLSKSFDEDETVEDSMESLFSPPRKKKNVSVEIEISFLISPQVHRVPLYFTVPHAFLTGSICLITPPPQRSFKDKLQMLVENGNTVASEVIRVIDTKKLNEKVNTPVANRAFANSYENFVLYGVHKYPKQLCGEFFGHRKNPIWIAKKHKLAEALDISTRTVVTPRRGQNAITCRVGHTGLSTDQLKENIEAFVGQLTTHSQGAPFDHILHIRVAGTTARDKRVALPIFSHSFKIPSQTSDAEPSKKRSKTE